MSFNESIKNYSERVLSMTDSIATEEATKTSMVMPLFQLMGYDVFNPEEFCPEYIADVGVKKGEKVDYAILQDGEPQILIECKWCGEDLGKHSSQLFRYFGTTTAKFGILTNGIEYKFYTDLDEPNKMDEKPFLTIDFSNLTDASINELRKFCKTEFDLGSIFNNASELKYLGLLKTKVKTLMESPDDQFVKYMLTDIYEGQKTQKVVDKFKPLVKKAYTMIINDVISDRFNSIMNEKEDVEDVNASGAKENTEVKSESKIQTTEEELQAYYIIRGMMVEVTDIEVITYRDTQSYFSVLYDDNSRKPVCRLYLEGKKKQVHIPDENKNFTRYYIDSLDELYDYKDEFVKVVKAYME